MDSRRLGRCQNSLRRGVGIETRDILRDGAVEQLDRLRQITPPFAKMLGVPLVE